MTETMAVLPVVGTDVSTVDAAVIDGAVTDAVQMVHVSTWVGEFARRDVSGFSDDDLLTAHDAAARLERLSGTLQARFAGEIAQRSTPDQPGGGLARRQGFGNAGTMVAHVTGGTKAAAFRAIEASKALMPTIGTGPLTTNPPGGADQTGGVDQPDGVDHLAQPGQAPPSTPAVPRYSAVAEAAFAGDLSVDAAGLITAGLETLTDCVPSDRLHALERRLVDKAVHLAAHEVRRMVASSVARADLVGHEERKKRQYEQRYFTWSEDHTGMVTLSGKLDAVTAAPLRTVIEQMVTHQFRARRDQDPSERDQRTVGQMRADSLFELCRHALGCKETDRSGIRTTIVVRMNQRDIDSGQGLGRIDGTEQPVSAGQLRRLAGDAGIIPEVLGGDSEVLDLGHTVRLFTRAQRLALLERDGGCAKCHAPPEHCEAHHIRWWEHGGETDLTNGVMLCTRCHHDVHRQGWDIVVHGGKVDFIPPPTIDPKRRPRPGGLAAITLDDNADTDDIDGLVGTNGTNGTNGPDGPDGTDPPHHDSGENSAPNHARAHVTGENAVRNPVGTDATGENSAWEDSARDNAA
jgi:hypothetical protein